ncbi:MAG: hypothetical protein LBM98_11500 [Oscillospiraceae bacterium]|nr:hypothetical protein [Oscillospiraceae bacterium]
MLRTCNALRIAGLPVLRKDGLGFALAPVGRNPRLIPPKPPSLEGGSVRRRGGVPSFPNQQGGFETRPYVAFMIMLRYRG